jgi:SWIM zinc finger
MSATDGKVPRMPQLTPWTAEQVAALAPDAASLASARKLARSGGMAQCGAGGERPSLWGLCQGSGKIPYQTCVDLTEPAYKCSCPSRKFPCKHALALLLRWAEGGVGAEAEPAWVTQWQASRATKAVKRQERAAAPRTESQERAAKRRAESRLDRVTAGAADLHQWLHDQIRHGIAGLDRAGYEHFDRIATRMVDAQAPGLAGMVRRLAGVPYSGTGWEGRMLAELSLLHLLTGAARGAGRHRPQ